MPLTTIIIALESTSRVPLLAPSSVTVNMELVSSTDFISLGLNQGISPSQYSVLFFDGVPPLFHKPTSPNGTTSQCSGIAPIGDSLDCSEKPTPENKLFLIVLLNLSRERNVCLLAI